MHRGRPGDARVGDEGEEESASEEEDEEGREEEGEARDAVEGDEGGGLLVGVGDHDVLGVPGEVQRNLRRD